MAELASDNIESKHDVERVGQEPSWNQGYSADASWMTKKLEQSSERAVSLPTLHLNDDRLNVRDNYSVNSDIAQLYMKNRPAIVRINTMDPKADASFSSSSGSGSIIDSTGIIATGYHVVKNATALRVKTADGKIYEATVLDADSAKDQALIKIKPDNPFSVFPTVALGGDSNQVAAGKELIALGFPKNQDEMHVSKLTTDSRMPLSNLRVKGGLFLGEDQNRDLIKALGPVFSGNSGGPAFDLVTGKQIGIVNMSDKTDTYITPVEDLQNFMARTKAKYNINTLPVQVAPERSRYVPSMPMTPYTQNNSPWGSGLQNLDRLLK